MCSRNGVRLASFLRGGAVVLGIAVLCAAPAHAEPAPSSASPRPNGGWGAVWSPQGDRIAFLSSDDGLPAEVWICDSQGLDFQCVTHGGAADAAWAADGRSLSYTTSRRGHPERWQVDLDSGRETPPAPHPGVPAETAQTPSPDGSSVAYTLADLSSRDLYLATGAAEAKRLTAGFTVGNVAWSPQGDRVAFDGLNPLSRGLPQVWLYDLGTGELAHIGSSGSFGPVWSPQGDLLAYTVLSPGKSNRIAIAAVDTVLKLTPRTPKGGAPRPELDVTRGGLVPDLLYQGDGIAWSPHDDLLAVVVRAEEGQQLWLVKADGTVAAKLAKPGLQFRFPAWSPDGATLALEAVQTGVSAFAEVWLTDAAGKEWRCLTPSRPSYWALSPAAGGRLAFLGNTSGTVTAWTLHGSAATGAPAGAASMPGTEGATAVAASPAGDRVLVLKPQEIALFSYDGKPLGTLPLAGAVQASWSPRRDRVALGLMDSKGEETVKLLSVSADGALAEVASVAGGNPAWRPDGGAVAFGRGNAVWRMDAAGGAPAALATIPAAEGEEAVVLSPAWDPTGARLAFAVARAGPAGWRQELWVLSVDGGNAPSPPRKVYSEPVSTEYAFSPARWDSLPAWSRDGRLLFASDWDGSPRIWSIRADGSDLRGVTPPRAAWPALGPDGLYFVRLDSGIPIWKASADGSNLVPLAWTG
jgi:Tol biopolymer transport system component